MKNEVLSIHRVLNSFAFFRPWSNDSSHGLKLLVGWKSKRLCGKHFAKIKNEKEKDFVEKKMYGKYLQLPEGSAPLEIRFRLCL